MCRSIFLIVIFFLSTSTIKAQAPPAPTFLEQLNLIISLGEIDHFKSVQGDFISSGADGAKVYSFPLPLQGFKMSIEQRLQGNVIVAKSLNADAVSGNISFLLNTIMRMIGGMPGYTSSDYKSTNPKGLEAYEAVTELVKEGSVVKVQVCKNTGGKEYSLVIKSY